MKRAIVLIGTLCLLGAVGCDKPATSEAKAENAATNTVTTNAGPAAADTSTQTAQPARAVTIDDRDLATPTDFEEAAEKAITAKNYKDALKALESEIAQP